MKAWKCFTLMNFMNLCMENEILSSLPKELQILQNPPEKLYFKGDTSLLEKRKIAIIGSRKMSLYTKNLVLELSALLAKNGFCVVSGGAIGVDITAHSTALPHTIGVFANGLSSIYPKSNAKIITQIYTQGLALSENEPFYLPKPYDFLLRNRLIIALCECVIIAQAHLQSGSLQSARLAKELGKKIYVLPQRLEESKGTNLLLSQNKANLIYEFHAFLQELGVNLQVKKENDELLSFCKKNPSLENALQKFGEKVFEYELLGKIEIEGVFIRVRE